LSCVRNERKNEANAEKRGEKNKKEKVKRKKEKQGMGGQWTRSHAFQLPNLGSYVKAG